MTQATRTLRLLAVALALLAHGLVTHAAAPQRNALHCSDVSMRDGRDADASIRQAHEFLSRLPPSTQEYLESSATAFHPERSFRVQQPLFREDLIWQNRGLTDRQLDLMVFVSVALSLDAAADQAAKLCRSLEEKKDDPSLHKHVANVTQYRSQALTLLAELSPRLSSVADYELRLYFQPRSARALYQEAQALQDTVKGSATKSRASLPPGATSKKDVQRARRLQHARLARRSVKKATADGIYRVIAGVQNQGWLSTYLPRNAIEIK